MSRRCSEYTAIKVGGAWYRAERYDYRSTTEYLVRGPFLNGVFKQDGTPEFFYGHVTAWKMVGGAPCCVNRTKSRKQRRGDPAPEMLTEDAWTPFWEAYAMKKGLVA